MKDFDVIIIGSGIGGLISAGILVSLGFRVLVLEKNSNSGGYLSSFERNGFIFDSALDCISGVTSGDLIYNVLKLLGTEKNIDFLKLDPIRVNLFPKLRVDIDTDINKYRERLKLLFPSETNGINSLFLTMNKVYDSIRTYIESISNTKTFIGISPDTLKFVNLNYLEFLNEHIKDFRLKAILSERCSFIGLPPSSVSAYSMIAMIMSYFLLGAHRPVGGFQKLADTLSNGIKNKKGTITYGSTVTKILTDSRGQCTGVICDKGEHYSSKYIISNADFNNTFNNLLGESYSSIPKELNRTVGISSSFFIVYAAIRGPIEQHSSIGYFPTYDMESFFKPEMTFKEGSTLGVTIASQEDKLRAPCNCHTVVLHEMTDNPHQYLSKSECTKKIMEKAEKIIPGIIGKTIFTDLATPETLERITGNFKGSAYGWKQIPKNFNTVRHRLKNFFIAGHWSNMGGGVLASAYSGLKTAKDICIKEGIDFEI